jgi:hypothetical protein
MYTVYKVTNKLNSKFYVGVHKTSNPNDSYLGSGLAILASIKKHGRKNFIKEILFNFDTAKEAYDKEIELTHDFHRPDTYNMRKGGVGGFTLENSRKGVAACLKVDRSFKVAGGKKGGLSSMVKKVGLFSDHSNSSRKGGLAHKGRIKSEEHRKNLSISLMGHKVSEITRSKIRAARKAMVAKSKSGDPLLITE